MNELLTRLHEMRLDWDKTREDFAADMEKQTGEEKAESFGWWDAACCVVQELDAILSEHEVPQ